jgi:transposase
MISYSIDVDDRQVVLRLEGLEKRLRSQLHASITKLTGQLLSRVRAGEPTRTGRLRQETQAFVDDKTNFVRGRVRVLAARGMKGHNVAAAALEYGAHRAVRVRQHTTHVEHVFDRIGHRQVAIVDAYTRRANITAQRFLRGPLAGMRPSIRAEFERVIQEAIKG